MHGLGTFVSAPTYTSDFLYGGVACKLATTTNSHASLIMQVAFKIPQMSQAVSPYGLEPSLSNHKQFYLSKGELCINILSTKNLPLVSKIDFSVRQSRIIY